MLNDRALDMDINLKLIVSIKCENFSVTYSDAQ